MKTKISTWTKTLLIIIPFIALVAIVLFSGDIIGIQGFVKKQAQLQKKDSPENILPQNIDTENLKKLSPINKLISITGTVAEINGSPIQDAKVALYFQYDSAGKTYRIEIANKKTDLNGKFNISEVEIFLGMNARQLQNSKPLPLFVKVSKENYLDTFVYDHEEIPKLMSQNTWNSNIILNQLPNYLLKKSDFYEVLYYPGYEGCANVAMEKMKFYYPLVKQFFIDAQNIQNFPIVYYFKTSSQLPAGNFHGSFNGLESNCYPWTDNTENASINDMWNTALPHELVHFFTENIMYKQLPYWSFEGLANYISSLIRNTPIDCNENNFLPVQDLQGAWSNYYDSASCFWKILDTDFPEIISKITQRANQKFLASPPTSNANFPELYLKTSIFKDEMLKNILIEEYFLSQNDAENYLETLFEKFYYDETKL